jgi:ankyrin repeat protein
MYAVMYGPASIRAFSEAGGKFTSQQMVGGRTAADMAQEAGGEVLKVFQQAVAEQGGLIYISSDDEFTALKNPEAVESFVKAGGHFDNKPGQGGMTPAMRAAWNGPAIVEAFSRFGGKFTTQQDHMGETAADIAGQRGSLAACNEAVRRQGGLITPTPANEYEAARIGAPGIEAFVRAGGKFTDKPNEKDLTSAMIAATSGPDAINAFYGAGGHFPDWQNKNGYTAAMAAVMSGPDAIRAFARAGGRFTEQQDHHGMTAAMWAASSQDPFWPEARDELGWSEWHMGRFLGRINVGGATIEAFSSVGGHFNDQQNMHGETAGMLAIANGPEAIRAYAKAGGHFTEQESSGGRTAEMYAAVQSVGTIVAFAEAGGKFTDHYTKAGSSETAVARRTPEMITAFSKVGGIFTDRKYELGWTSAMIASNLGELEWMQIENEGRASGQSPSPALRAELVAREKARNIAAAKAYQEALVRQGGLRHVQ